VLSFDQITDKCSLFEQTATSSCTIFLFLSIDYPTNCLGMQIAVKACLRKLLSMIHLLNQTKHNSSVINCFKAKKESGEGD
jgi:hypothetical protein